MPIRSTSLTLDPVTRTAWPLRSDLRHRGARERRTATMVARFVAVVQRLQRFAQLVKERHQQWREARATYQSLRHLDDRTLRDLGFDRLEISSVAAEVSGQAERTRSHVLAAL